MTKKNKLMYLNLSFFEINGKVEFAFILKKNKKKATKALNDFLVGVKNEATDTKEASRIIVKYVAHQKITKEEEKQLKNQVFDVFKILGIGIPFMLIPGASILIPFILKAAEKKGIDIFPSGFSSKEVKEDV